jgi:choline-sulfatase
MVRMGDWKYHYCHGSAPQLFNLAEDPGEWNNRASDPSCAAIKAELDHVITGGRFDLDRIGSEVWERLALKEVVNDAMKANGTSWDYQVERNAADQYVRA